MSSLQVNDTVSFDEKSKTFFRRDSFDKLQSTAYYSLQLAAAILSRESLMHLFDVFVCHSRTILQKAVLLLSLPAFKMCCAVVLFWIDAFTKYTGINVAFEKKVVTTSTNVEPEKTYILRVQKRKFIPEVAQPKVTPSEPAMPTPNVAERLKPIAEMDLHVLPRHSFTSDKLFRSDSNSDMGSNTSISSRHNIGLVVIVYGSATLVYIQLMLLAVFLQSATTPPGLIFLVSSLGYIGYIVHKMCFVKSKSKEDTNTPTPAPVSAPAASKIEKSDDSMKNSKENQRLSRSMTRRFLYFHNKTLSKIKLL